MNRKKKIRNIIIWSVVGLLALWFIYAQFIKQKEANVDVQTEQVVSDTIFSEVSATGTINPIEMVDVGTQVSGQISHVYVDFNDQVKKGQVLARMDTRNLNSSLNESLANLEKAEIAVQQADRALQREKELSDKGLTSELALEQARDTYESAVAALKIARIQKEKSSVNLGYAEIVSPIDGIVISKDAEVGQTVAAAFTAPTLFSIVNDLTKMKIEASVDEADIGQVKKGQKVVFTVDAYPDEEFQGVVDQVQIKPVVVQNVVTYKTIVLIDNPELKLMPGMTATLIIQTNEIKSPLTVPNAAFGFNPLKLDWKVLKRYKYSMKKLDEEVENSVWILDEKTFREVPVDILFSNGIRSSVAGDISTDDQVITNCFIDFGDKKKGGLFSGPDEEDE